MVDARLRAGVFPLHRAHRRNVLILPPVITVLWCEATLSTASRKVIRLRHDRRVLPAQSVVIFERERERSQKAAR
jgi:hypothetical protein